jgi:hypothetical protein
MAGADTRAGANGGGQPRSWTRVYVVGRHSDARLRGEGAFNVPNFVVALRCNRSAAELKSVGSISSVAFQCSLTILYLYQSASRRRRG